MKFALIKGRRPIRIKSADDVRVVDIEDMLAENGRLTDRLERARRDVESEKARSAAARVKAERHDRVLSYLHGRTPFHRPPHENFPWAVRDLFKGTETSIENTGGVSVSARWGFDI